MNLYLYIERNTPIHRLDPRTKLFILIGSFILMLLFQHPLYLLPLVILLLFYGGRGNALGNLKRVRFLLVMIAIFSIVTWSLMIKGSTYIIGPISTESLLYGVSNAIKIDAMIISGIIFLSTTKNEELALGLIRLRIPYPLCFALSLSLRLLPTFMGTAFTVLDAQRSRGLDVSSGNIIARARKYIPLMGPILLTTIRSTNHLAMALESRGFGLSERTSLIDIHYSWTDFIAILILIIFLGFAIILRLKGFGVMEIS